MIGASLVTQHPSFHAELLLDVNEREGGERERESLHLPCQEAPELKVQNSGHEPLPDSWKVTGTACNSAVQESPPVPVSLIVLPQPSCTLSMPVRVYATSSRKPLLLHDRWSSVGAGKALTIFHSSK